MNAIRDAFDTTYRDYETDGVPATGSHEPVKSEIRNIGAVIDQAIAAGVLGGVDLRFATKAAMDADLAHAAGTTALVYADANPLYIDIWTKAGAPGAGAWANSNVLHNALAALTAPALATVNAAVATISAHDEVIGRAAWSFDWELPSPNRAGKATRIQQDRAIIDLRPADSAYRDGYARQYNDIVRIEMMDLAVRYHGRPVGEHIWVPISMFTRFAGRWVEHINFSWNDLINGNDYNTGQTPALWGAPAYFIGPVAAGYAAIEAGGGSGPFHGRIQQAGGMGLTTTDGVRNAASIVDGTNIRDLWARLEVIEFDTLVFDQSWTYLAHDSSYAAATVNCAQIFDPNNSRQMVVTSTAQVAAAPATGITTGVAQMIAFRLANRIQARLRNDALSAVWNVGLRNDAITNIGDAKRVTGWHTDFPGHALEMENPASYIQFRRNGFETAVPAFQIKDEAAGPKVRAYTHGGGGVLTAETGNSLSQYAVYNGVRANSA